VRMKNWEDMDDLYNQLLVRKIFHHTHNIGTFRITCYSLPWIIVRNLSEMDIDYLWQRHISEVPGEQLNDPSADRSVRIES